MEVAHKIDNQLQKVFRLMEIKDWVTLCTALTVTGKYIKDNSLGQKVNISQDRINQLDSMMSKYEMIHGLLAVVKQTIEENRVKEE